VKRELCFQLAAFAAMTISTAHAATTISSAPYTISASGSYQLGGNLQVGGAGAAITVMAEHVTLDLAGYTISCGDCAGATGIIVALPFVNIQNGFVRGFTGATNSQGIAFMPGASGRVEHITASENQIGLTGLGTDRIDVVDSNFDNNRGNGISCLNCRLTLTNSRVTANGSDGLVMGPGMVIGSFVYDNNGHGVVLYPGPGNDNLTHITNTFIQSTVGDAIFQIAGSFFTSGMNTLWGNGNFNFNGGDTVGGTVNMNGMSSAGGCYNWGQKPSPGNPIPKPTIIPCPTGSVN
jgi:hypothetical protein